MTTGSEEERVDNLVARANKANKLRSNRSKQEALLLKTTEERSYFDVLRNLRTKMQPNDAAKMKGIR